MGADYRTTFSLKTMKAELKSVLFWRNVCVELISVILLIVMVVLSLTTLNPDIYEPGVTHFGLLFAFLVFLLIEGYGPIGGAIMNPPASIALCLGGHFTPLRAFAYLCAQVGGAAAGAGIGYGFTPVARRDAFPPIQPSEELTDVQAVMIEALLTFNLIFVAASVSDMTNKPAVYHGLPALSTAFCIGVGILAAGTHTGGIQNPLAPFALAILRGGDFHRHWVYWVGPVLGGCIGGLSYEFTQYLKRRFSIETTTDVNHLTPVSTSDVQSDISTDYNSNTLSIKQK